MRERPGALGRRLLVAVPLPTVLVIMGVAGRRISHAQVRREQRAGEEAHEGASDGTA
jgi:hypothetical protein